MYDKGDGATRDRSLAGGLCGLEASIDGKEASLHSGPVVEKCVGWANLALISGLKTHQVVAKCFPIYP